MLSAACSSQYDEKSGLGIAYEYDPYFSLSIARVDPLPHQLEAVYDYFLRLPRIRFLLADDPGAGKTINVKLSAQAAPLYLAATKQNRKLKAVLAKMERLSRAALARLAKPAEHTD